MVISSSGQTVPFSLSKVGKYNFVVCTHLFPIAVTSGPLETTAPVGR